MSQNYSNIAGTTSSEFRLSSGSTAMVRYLVLTGEGGTTATNRESQPIVLGDHEFYDLKVLAKDGTDIYASQMRGLITTINTTRIEDVFAEDISGADITVTNTSGNLNIALAGASTIEYTISITLTRMG